MSAFLLGWIAALLLVILISVSLVLFLVPPALWAEVLHDRRRAALDFLPIAITQNTPFF
jgi:hypothetical protein